MYQVSNAFKIAANQAVQEHRITGTIGSVSFSETNIVDGSFTITNQSTDTSDVVLGSCYVGQLTAEFIGLNIEWGKWINKTITPTFQLKTDENTWESVPLGVFKIKEAKHTERGVQVTAYDNMIKFDKKFKKSHFMNMSGIWNIISQLCTDAGVTLGMTRAEIEALPNGDRDGINIYGSKGKKNEFANDITTNRDLLFWVAQTLGCFATINRAGQLEFRKYTQTVVDKITDHNRIDGATFADYVTHYVGIYVENLDNNTEDYYGYDVTALTEERNETLSEITSDNELIAGYIEDLAEWDAKLANHECTQQEYDEAVAEITAAMHPLELEVKQLSKRLNWLNEAIAQASDDGSDMVLGANPLVMAKSLVTRDSQRREILGALDGITYTPFNASVVCGCIYDLGDVIQFSGGLYNSETDSFGCVMSYTYTHNDGTELEGFGVDPSVVVVRNKTQKSTDRASKNAVNAKESFNGFNDPQDEFPSGGKDGDIYIKRKVEKIPKITIVNNEQYWTQGFFTPHNDMYKVHSVIVDRDTGKYSVSAYGNAYVDHPGSSLTEGTPIVELHGFTQVGTYRFHVKANYTADYDGAHWGNNLGIAVLVNDTSSPTAPLPGNFSRTTYPVGIALNAELVQNTYYEYTCDFEINQGFFEQIQNGTLYMYFPRLRCLENWNISNFLRFNMQDFYVEYLDSGEPWYEEEEYIEDVYTYIKDDDNGNDGDDNSDAGGGRWVKIDYIADADESSWSGLSVNDRKIVSLKDYVMRAWYKADPPQIERDFSQFCVRYTGVPDKQIAINHSANHVWQNVKITNDDDNVFKIKCKGTYNSGEINYVVYAISGLVTNKKYYFNFRCDFSNNATFSSDSSIGCGLVFNTTGILNTSSYSGTPDHFDPETGYYAFMRQTGAWYADFELTAAASTMYMCVLTQAVTTAEEVTFTISEMVIAQEERKLIRNIYLYDYTAKEWLKYKPFSGSTSGGDEGGSVVSIEPILSQGTKIADFSIDGNAGELYAPDNSYTLPIASDNTLGGIKVGANLSIDPQTGVLSASAAPSDIEDLSDVNVDEETLTDGQVLKWDDTEGEWVNADESGGSQAVELTKAQYDALPSTEKNDPNKVYYVTDYPSGSGGISYNFAYYTKEQLVGQYVANGTYVGMAFLPTKASIDSSFDGNLVMCQGVEVDIEYNGATYVLPATVRRCINTTVNNVESVLIEIAAINTLGFDLSPYDPTITPDYYLHFNVTITFVCLS